MTLDEARRLLVEREADRNRAEVVIEELRKFIAEAGCPLKVGDITENPGYSYKGRKIRVDHVVPSGGYRGEWLVRGTLLTADGKVGKIMTDFSQSQYESAKSRP